MSYFASLIISLPSTSIHLLAPPHPCHAPSPTSLIKMLTAPQMAFSIVSYFASLIIYLQVAPIAFANIGWKFYLVFLLLLFCFTVPLFFYFPESKGVSLEEISRLFGDKATVISLKGPTKDEEREETAKAAEGV